MGQTKMEVLRQGVWASLTGGWFYDPSQTVFVNTFHLYLWLFLFIYPFALFFFYANSAYVSAVYISGISAVFVIIKVFNCSLIAMYDVASRIEIPCEQRSRNGGELGERVTNRAIDLALSETHRGSGDASALDVNDTDRIEVVPHGERVAPVRVLNFDEPEDHYMTPRTDIAAARTASNVITTTADMHDDEFTIRCVRDTSDSARMSYMPAFDRDENPYANVTDCFRTIHPAVPYEGRRPHVCEIFGLDETSEPRETEPKPAIGTGTQPVAAKHKNKSYSTSPSSTTSSPLSSSTSSISSSLTDYEPNYGGDDDDDGGEADDDDDGDDDDDDDDDDDRTIGNVRIADDCTKQDEDNNNNDDEDDERDETRTGNCPLLETNVARASSSASTSSSIFSLRRLFDADDEKRRSLDADASSSLTRRPSRSASNANSSSWSSLMTATNGKSIVKCVYKKDDGTQPNTKTARSSTPTSAATSLPPKRRKTKKIPTTTTTPQTSGGGAGGTSSLSHRKRERYKSPLQPSVPASFASTPITHPLVTIVHATAAATATTTTATTFRRDNVRPPHYNFRTGLYKRRTISTTVTTPTITTAASSQATRPSHMLEDSNILDSLQRQQQQPLSTIMSTPDVPRDSSFVRFLGHDESYNSFFERMVPITSRVIIPQRPARVTAAAAAAAATETSEHTCFYYPYTLLAGTRFELTIKIYLDRLELGELLDPTTDRYEIVLAVVLSACVAAAASMQLHMLRMHCELTALLFCFVTAGAQYSLLKSVQPDCSSPTHGLNRIVAFSRPVYFCLFSIGVLVTDSLRQSLRDADATVLLAIYGLPISRAWIFSLMDMLNELFTLLILFSPLIFLLGLMPQVTTFAMYLLEQIDMHLFGGSAMTNFTASLYAIVRSLIVVICLFGIAFAALSESPAGNHILFSLFLGLLAAISYHLSRSVSDPTILWLLVKEQIWPAPPPRVLATPQPSTSAASAVIQIDTTPAIQSAPPKHQTPSAIDTYRVDPLPEKLKQITRDRLKSDIIICSFIGTIVTGLHLSSAFVLLAKHQIALNVIPIVSIGLVVHYIVPQLRRMFPFRTIARPVLKSREHNRTDIHGPAHVTWFEYLVMILGQVEQMLLFPLLVCTMTATSAPALAHKFGTMAGALVTVIFALKVLRTCYARPQHQYLVVVFTALFYRYDAQATETVLVDYFLMTLVFDKTYEFLLKLNFVLTYVAPWQITWGSAFHAVTQPFSVPHSSLLVAQAFIGSILSAPLNPFLGSALFILSYMRPVRFWERDYNTLRLDNSNSRLSSQLDRNLGLDDNNLNSIFYEHLTRSLQHSLCGDLIMGRWGNVSQGDCFVLTSDSLNCLVHIIEMGNGFVTFQVRGLEFRGTYCQQREVEAITSNLNEDNTCCCCCFHPNQILHLLRFSRNFYLRWLAWEIVSPKYILEGYAVSDNNAVSMLQMYDFRKVLIKFYVKAIVFFLVQSRDLETWLRLHADTFNYMDGAFVDLDPAFNAQLDDDFDTSVSGVSRRSFCRVYHNWIAYCVGRRDFGETSGTQAVAGTSRGPVAPFETGHSSVLVSLCLALSLLGRRALVSSAKTSIVNVEVFLYNLHALFKGDYRISGGRDEWIFGNMQLLESVVVPALRMSLKLHQDNFLSPDEYDDDETLHQAIVEHERTLVLAHESDPIWRNAILAGADSLLALRQMFDECAEEEYKIIMLNKRFLQFRVIKLNRECVRGLWSGQQQELIFLRNRNPERGSIQNAIQILRNIINSSCDQPIGYPIYVSPLTTSYSDSNRQLAWFSRGSLNCFGTMKKTMFEFMDKTRQRVTGDSCTHTNDIPMQTFHVTPVESASSPLPPPLPSAAGGGRATTVKIAGGTTVHVNDEPSPATETEPATAKRHQLQYRVRVVDANAVYDAINLGRRIDVQWPNETWRRKGGRSHWKHWVPKTGMQGTVVHKWTPSHPEPLRRSHVDKTIVLVEIDDFYVPIAESAVQSLDYDEVFV